MARLCELLINLRAGFKVKQWTNLFLNHIDDLKQITLCNQISNKRRSRCWWNIAYNLKSKKNYLSFDKLQSVSKVIKNFNNVVE